MTIDPRAVALALGGTLSGRNIINRRRYFDEGELENWERSRAKGGS